MDCKVNETAQGQGRPSGGALKALEDPFQVVAHRSEPPKRDNYIRGPDARRLQREEAVEFTAELNKVFDQTKLSFQVDDRSEKVVIKVIDKESNEVIRQIPSEEVVALRERVEHLRGMLFNQKV